MTSEKTSFPTNMSSSLQSVQCPNCGTAIQFKKKVKRQPTAYNDFFKQQMATEQVKALPPKERMAHVAGLWKARGGD